MCGRMKGRCFWRNKIRFQKLDASCSTLRQGSRQSLWQSKRPFSEQGFRKSSVGTLQNMQLPSIFAFLGLGVRTRIVKR